MPEAVVDVFNLVLPIALFIITEVNSQTLPNRYAYVYCSDKWDARYPFLAEVRYSRPKEWREFKYHKNRHGVLITNRAVLTRGQDLDNYPDKKERDMVPTAKLWEECNWRKSKGLRACIYVNIRRPIKDIEGGYCGENILVTKVVHHPKHGPSATLEKLFEYKQDKTFKQFLQNMKFPFAIAVLDHPVNSELNQPFVPTAILPRSALDFLYWLRRVDTLGPTSTLCEYPTYEELKHEGYYSKYSHPAVTVMSLRDREYSNYQEVLCPIDWSRKRKGFEGKRVMRASYNQEKEYQRICNESLLENIQPYSFLVWKGRYGTFDEKFKTGGDRRQMSDDKLGAPIVCDGVTIGITSTWLNRGTSRKDVYVGTTLMRAYGWLIYNMLIYSASSYHRAYDDAPFLGSHYQFKRRNYPKRQYDQSMFELSLNEQISPYAGSRRITISLFGTVTLPVLYFLYFL